MCGLFLKKSMLKYYYYTVLKFHGKQRITINRDYL